MINERWKDVKHSERLFCSLLHVQLITEFDDRRDRLLPWKDQEGILGGWIRRLYQCHYIQVLSDQLKIRRGYFYRRLLFRFRGRMDGWTDWLTDKVRDTINLA